MNVHSEIQNFYKIAVALRERNMAKTILVVDDKLSVRRLLQDYLIEQGFQVITAENGRMALFVARQTEPDLVLLDIMMPDMDGYEFIQTYRRERDVPIILLTAKLDETDKVLGLELGADDYVTKPFGMRELLARIRAVLRRSGGEGLDSDRLDGAGILLDKSKHTVSVHGDPVHLTPTEFDLLAALMSAPGRVFSRMDLLRYLQGMAFEGSERTIDVHVRHLRKKIEPDPEDPYFVETVFGIGYRFRMEDEIHAGG